MTAPLSPAQQRCQNVWGTARPVTHVEIALPDGYGYTEAELRRRCAQIASPEVHCHLDSERGSLIVEASSALLDPASALLVAEALFGVRELGDQYADIAAWWWETIAMRRQDSVVRWDEYGALCECPPSIPWGALPPAAAFAPRRRTLELRGEVARSLARCAAGLAIPVADVLCAVWLVFLARWTDTDSLLVADVFSGRTLDELRAVAGPLERALPLPFAYDAAASFSQVALHVHAERAAAEAVQDYFVLPHGYLPFAFAWREAQYAGPGAVASIASLLEPFVFQLEVCATGASLQIALGWNANVIAAREAASALLAFDALLAALTADPAARVGDPPLRGFGGADARDVESPGDVQSPGDVESPGGEGRRELENRLREAMQQHRERPALLGDAGPLDYGELDRRTRAVADELLAGGLRPGDRVAVLATSSIAAIVAVAGVLRAGGAYVPIDPDAPADRLRYMLDDSNARFVLRPGAALETRSVSSGGDPSIAYVIYTSGSTGLPKGVAVPARAVCALVDALQAPVYAGLPPHRRVALLASLTFDASVQQLFAALLGGHALLPVDAAQKRDPAALCDLLQRHGVEIADGTPSLLDVLVRHVPERLAALPVRQWLIGGEPLTRDLTGRFFARAAAGVRIANVYGLTECGVDSTLMMLEGRDERSLEKDVESSLEKDAESSPRTVPIGRPLANADVLLLDARGRLLPCGAVGEIAIGGPGLAAGYLNDPELTAARFVPSSSAPARLLFRTGDRGWVDADGAFHFVERRDEQVKVRGHRIGLGEIRAKLLAHQSVEQAHVLLHHDAEGRPELAAFVTASRPLARNELRAYLKKHLPEPMRPRILMTVDDWPLTSSGKLDRKNLLARAAAQDVAFAAESGSIDDRITAIYRRLLDDPYLSPDDDFFDAGGNSLTALEAASQVTRQLQINAEVRTIYQTRTAAALGAALRSRGNARRLVALRPSRTGAPALFLLPPSLGISHIFLPLAVRLPSELHVWGVDYGKGEIPLETTIESLAAGLLDELSRESGFTSPTLVGYSAGAVVAFEIARLLELRGRDCRLIFVDNNPEWNLLAPALPIRAEGVGGLTRRYRLAHVLRADLVALEAAGNPTPAGMERWAAWTTGRFRHATVPGTHETLLDPANVDAFTRQLCLGLEFLKGEPQRAIAGRANDASELR